MIKRLQLPLNRKLSLEIADKIGAEPRNCWQNSVIAQTHLPGSLYIEGWAIATELFIPFEHGWLEHQGYVVDVTWVPLDNHPSAYFSGRKLGRSEVKSISRRSSQYPLVGVFSHAPLLYQLAYFEAELFTFDELGVTGSPREFIEKQAKEIHDAIYGGR